MLSEQQVAEILQASATLEQAADELINEANEAGGRDNITVVLFRVEEVGSDRGVDQPTIVGLGAPARPSDARARRTTDGAGVAVAARAQTGRRERSGSAAPPSVPPPPTRRRRYAKPLAAVLATLIVLCLIGAGGWLASRQLYFIGTNAQGIVTIYRGLPYELPAGIRLYETFYVSGVPAALVPVDRRAALFNHHLRSQSDASTLVHDLELGKVTS